MVSLANYFNRRAVANFIGRRYAELLHRGKQFVESAELNESQGITYERLREIGDGAFGAVSIRDGGTIVIDQAAGSVRLAASRIWAGGYMHNVPDAELLGVPMVGTVVIGVAVAETVVTDVEDVDLKGIVPNTASQGEPLAARLRYDATWATEGETFYPVYTLIDGQLPNEVVTPQDNAAEGAVERHIEETHGSHIVDGFTVSAGGFDDDSSEQTFIIAAGTLRAKGRRVRRTADQRFRRVEDPELVQVNGETHLYPADGIVTLNNGPIADVQTVTVIKVVTKNVTHQISGGIDPLPDTPVYEILSVSAGGTNYAQTTSWIKTGDGLDWSPAGAEPSPGTTVSVTYRYIATVSPQEINRQSIKLETAVTGQPVTVHYRWKLRRTDVLAVDLDGNIVYLKGLSTRYNPVPPTVPFNLTPLCRVENQWGLPPVLTDVDQRRLTEAEVRAMLRTLLDFGDLVSLLSLEKDIQERDPASRRGSFVDPFSDDMQRDLGISQEAAVFDGFVQLPIDVTPQYVDIGEVPITLPFVEEAVLSQPFRTLGRPINKYLAFEPIPSEFSINPAIDRWNVTSSSTRSKETSSIAQVGVYRPDLLGTDRYGTVDSRQSTSTVTRRLSSSTSTALPFLRQIAVNFTAKRFGPGEKLQSLTFDGIEVLGEDALTANGEGVMTGSFNIPANVRAGTKRVEIIGKGGSRGVTSFTGQGTMTRRTYVETTHTHTVEFVIDPVAQSFVLSEPRQITGVKVEFTARGDVNKPVVLEMRTLIEGFPGAETVAEGILPGNFSLGDPNVVKPENWTRIGFRFLTTVRENEWHAIALLSDDAVHGVAVAQLGDQSNPNSPRGYDVRRQEWIRSNPALGDFFDGSNGRSWLVAPDTDLTHEILAARYTSFTHTVVIGTFDLETINAGGISDVLVLLIIEEPSVATRVRLEMVRENGSVIAFDPNVRLELDEYLTEQVTIRMVLTGTATLSPIVMPECQILWGRIKSTAAYVSQAVALDQTNGALKVRSVVEVATPGTSSVTMSIGNDGAWTAQGSPLATALGDGWVEREYLTSPVATQETRQRIVLTGTPKDRPLVRNLRVRATEV
ncbi:DUF4815 domain-containing protein [Devosia naphthalenivorans]|uniref:DUF4815 domain-containing protein n=1 Tax=Devosia naphthalenivorans TaxID=2082392 RepID=UPI000D398477|nr:DUF4815 domain-containing protein [Devosia naphthalenivorans]